MNACKPPKTQSRKGFSTFCFEAKKTLPKSATRSFLTKDCSGLLKILFFDRFLYQIIINYKETKSMRRKQPFFKQICLMISIFALMNIGIIHGQSIQYGKLNGKILLSGGEFAAGVLVKVTSNALVTGERTTVTSEKGSFVFLNLPIGKYTVTASSTGFKTAVQRNVTVSAATVTTVNLMMKLGEITETVVVTSTPPVVDIKTSTVDTKIHKKMLDKLPSTRDAFYDLSLSTPGMFDVGKNSGEVPSPTAYGGATTENVFLVNGVDTTNPRGGAWGSMVNVNYSTVEEVRVIALGSKAEYGSFSGVAIDVVTKSGSNQLHGNFGVFSMLGDPSDNSPDPGSLGRDWLYMGETDNVYQEPIKNQELSLTLGGPLIKNRLWFYTGFDLNESRMKVPFFEPESGYKGRYFDAKLTGELGNNVRAWAAYHFENNDSENSSWGTLNWDPSVVYGSNDKVHSMSSQLMWNLSGTTAFSAKYLGFWTDQSSTLPDDAPDHPAYVNWWKWTPSDVGVNGSFHAIEAQKSSRHTVQADISHYAEDFLGEHDLKVGVQYTQGKGNWLGGWFHGYANYAYPYRWTQNIGYMQSWYGDTGFEMYVRQPHQDPYLTVRTSDSLGVFVDDQWTIGNRLTLNVGVRYDRMTSKFGDGEVYNPINHPSEVTDLTVARTRTGSDNIFDFKTFSPRVGFSYQLTKDYKTVLRASYGRYYTPISVENLGNAGPDMDPERTRTMFYSLPFDQIDLNGDNYVDGNEVIAATRLIHGATPYNDYWDTDDPSLIPRIGSDMKNQHTDQFTVSIEREIANNLSIAATYIYKNTKNLIVRWPIDKLTGRDWFDFAETESYTTQNGVTTDVYKLPLVDFNQDGVVDGQDVDYFFTGGNYEWRNMPSLGGIDAHRRYQGIQLVLKKQYSDRWQMMSSFLYSMTDGMASRNKRQDQDYNMEGPNIYNDAWLGDFNQAVNNMEGPLPFTPKFELKFNASYRVPVVEVDLGVRYRFTTGRPIWEVEDLDSGQLEGNRVFSWDTWMGEGDIPEDPYILASGEPQLVSTDVTDPLYLPSRHILDLHLEKSFSLGQNKSLNLVLDFFNIFNDGTPTNTLIKAESLGRVNGISYPPRQIRFSAMFEF